MFNIIPKPKIRAYHINVVELNLFERFDNYMCVEKLIEKPIPFALFKKPL